MNFFSVSVFIRLSHVVGHFYPGFIGQRALEAGGDWHPERVISETDREKFRNLYSDYERLCEIHDLAGSLATVRKMLSVVSDPSGTYGRFFGYGEELWGRLADETEIKEYLSLSSDESRYYHAEAPFGLNVATRFQNAEYDIEEASKCLGLERGTASAFHSIRCLEAGIRALSRCLGIPDPTKAANRSWFKTLESLKSEMDRRWVGSSSRLSGDGRFFEEAYAALSGIMNPWRNATMHLDQKYTLEEAAHIFEVVKGFMRKVASRCDEDGEPKA